MSTVALEIPRRLNDPPRMFFWEIDVSLLFLGAVLAGMVAGFFVTGCVAGALLAWAYGKAKSGEHPAFAPAQSGGSLDRLPYSHSIVAGGFELTS